MSTERALCLRGGICCRGGGRDIIAMVVGCDDSMYSAANSADVRRSAVGGILQHILVIGVFLCISAVIEMST